MFKKIILSGLIMSTILTGCIGTDDSVYTRDLDVVYTQKKDGYDFNSGSYQVAKTFFIVSDTLLYTDERGKNFKIPGDIVEGISEQDVVALKLATEQNMLSLGWTQLDPNVSPTEEQLKASVFLIISANKTKYVGGGYYPIYPGWGYPGYPGWGWNPWVPYYYSYETASVAVSMIEPYIAQPVNGEAGGQIVWESFLSGYLTNSFDLQLVSQGIYQGFDQSSSYLDRN